MGELITIKIASPIELPIGKLVVLNLDSNKNISDLKLKIIEEYDKVGQPAPIMDRQRLIFRGRILKDNDSIISVVGSSKNVHFHLVIKPESEQPAKSGGFFGFFQTSTPLPQENSVTTNGSSSNIDTSVSNSSSSSLPVLNQNNGLSRNFWTSSTNFGENQTQTTPQYTQQEADSTSESSTQAQIYPPSTSNNSENQTFASDVAGGLINSQPYLTTSLISNTPCINIVGPHDTIIPIPEHQISFARNDNGEELCMISPEALSRLSRIFQSPIETEGIYSRTQFYSETPIGRPHIRGELEDNHSNSTPQFYSVQPSQFVHTRLQQENDQSQLQERSQIQNGLRLRMGRQYVDIHLGPRWMQNGYDFDLTIPRANLFQTLYRFFSLIVRVIIFVDILAMHYSVTIQAMLVVATLFVIFLWRLNFFQDVLRRGADIFWNTLQIFTHPGPENPHLNQANGEIHENAPNRQNLPRRDGFLYKARTFAIMFIGSLVPFVYERWGREDRLRQAQAEQNLQNNEVRTPPQPLIQENNEIDNQQQLRESSELEQEHELPEYTEVSEQEVQSESFDQQVYQRDVEEGSSGSRQYQGHDQTINHR